MNFPIPAWYLHQSPQSIHSNMLLYTPVSNEAHIGLKVHPKLWWLGSTTWEANYARPDALIQHPNESTTSSLANQQNTWLPLIATVPKDSISHKACWNSETFLLWNIWYSRSPGDLLVLLWAPSKEREPVAKTKKCSESETSGIACRDCYSVGNNVWLDARIFLSQFHSLETCWKLAVVTSSSPHEFRW